MRDFRESERADALDEDADSDEEADALIEAARMAKEQELAKSLPAA